MSLSQVQTLATQTLFAVENGKNLSDELAHIIVQNPELSPQRQRYVARYRLWLPTFFRQPEIYARQIIK